MHGWHWWFPKILFLSHKAVLLVQETLRMYPPVGIGQVRISNSHDITLADRLHIPAGTCIWVPHHAIQNASFNWDDPTKFMPGVLRHLFPSACRILTCIELSCSGVITACCLGKPAFLNWADTKSMPVSLTHMLAAASSQCMIRVCFERPLIARMHLGGLTAIRELGERATRFLQLCMAAVQHMSKSTLSKI